MAQPAAVKNWEAQQRTNTVLAQSIKQLKEDMVRAVDAPSGLFGGILFSSGATMSRNTTIHPLQHSALRPSAARGRSNVTFCMSSKITPAALTWPQETVQDLLDWRDEMDITIGNLMAEIDTLK